MGLFIETLSTNPQGFFMQLFVVVFSICCHEYSHARVALWQGDSTAADDGHLTLNPLKQMGVYSLVILAFVGIAWGKVPVDPSRMKNRYSDALVSFAGPAMNIALFVVSSILFTVVITNLDEINPDTLFQENPILVLARLGAIFNIVLFSFNMMPVPMLDGWAVFKYIFPKLGTQKSEFFNGFTVFICFLAIMGIDYLVIFADFSFQLLVNMLITVFVK